MTSMGNKAPKNGARHPWRRRCVPAPTGFCERMPVSHWRREASCARSRASLDLTNRSQRNNDVVSVGSSRRPLHHRHRIKTSDDATSEATTRRRDERSDDATSESTTRRARRRRHERGDEATSEATSSVSALLPLPHLLSDTSLFLGDPTLLNKGRDSLRIRSPSQGGTSAQILFGLFMSRNEEEGWLAHGRGWRSGS